MFFNFAYSTRRYRVIRPCVAILCRGCLLPLYILLTFAPALAQDSLTIGTSYKMLLSTPEQNGALDNIAKEAFARLGIAIELPFLPAERSLLSANTGVHDGELNRVAGIEKNYQNLVRVPESMMTFRFVAFTKNGDFKTVSWSALAPYRIGVIKGWKVLEENIHDFPNVTCVNSAQQLFTLLDKDRIDIALYGELLGHAQLQSMGIDGYTVLQPPLATRDMYMYLHKKHSKLVDQVARALHAMKEDGTYDRLFTEATSHFRFKD